MTDRYPYGKVRTNDTIVRLSEGTEAGIARSEFQQVLFCTGEAVSEEPIMFGRAYELPPYFTYSSIVKNNEIILVETDCDDPDLAAAETRRVTGATVGIASWVRDEQGMYIGANMWYRVDAVDLDRSGGGVGAINWTYNENTNVAEIPDCGGPGDFLLLIATYSGTTSLSIGGGWSLDDARSTNTPAQNSLAMWSKPWDDDSGSLGLNQTVEYVAVGLIRGMTGELRLTNRYTFNAFTGSKESDPGTLSMTHDQEVMIALLYSQGANGLGMADASFVGLTKLNPGPTNTGFGLGHIYVGLGDSTVPQQAAWDLPIAQFSTSEAMDWWGWRVMVG